MKAEIKVGIIVAVIEAVLALAGGYVLYLIQEDSIEKKTVETIAGYFDEVDENMTYEQVLQFLYKNSQEKDQMIASLQQEKAELMVSKEKEEEMEANEETANSAQDYADINDYETAISILKGAAVQTPQMEMMLADYTERYEAQITAQADALTVSEKYDEAIDCIDHALEILPDSSVLTQKRIDVMNSRPQLLMTVLKPYETNGYEERLAGEFMKMGGTEYSDGFILGPNYQTSYAIFNLNGQYTEMSGMIGHVDGFGNSSETVTIFADGVFVETIEIDYKALPLEFSIDVTGVRQLIVERTEGYTETGLAELIIR